MYLTKLVIFTRPNGEINKSELTSGRKSVRNSDRSVQKAEGVRLRVSFPIMVCN